MNESPKLNPDQLQFIHSGHNPKTNPARYGDTVEEDFVKEPPPTIILGPNAVYITDASYWPQKGGEILPPVLTAIEPNSLSVTAPDNTIVLFRGSDFSQDSVIMWQGAPEPTTFIDATQLSTLVKTSTVEAPLPFTLQAWIATGDKESAKLDFTFTE